MKRANVLLVEDNVGAAQALKLALEAYGFQVEVVHTGRETVGMLIHQKSDVIVVDLTLPDIDGAVVAEMVRRDWPDLPIILTSGYAQPARIADFLGKRNTAFLQKPYTIDALIDAIEAP